MSIEYFGSYYGDGRFKEEFDLQKEINRKIDVKKKKQVKKTKKKKKSNIKPNPPKLRVPNGKFKVEYSDGEIVEYITGKENDGNTIKETSPLALAIVKNEVGTYIELNGEKIKILEKDFKIEKRKKLINQNKKHI